MTYLSILWHMHQPFYAVNGRIGTPILLFRTLFNYYPMASIAERYPDVKLNFNLTPVLLKQIEGIYLGQYSDDFLSILLEDETPPEKLLSFAEQLPSQVIRKNSFLKVLLNKIETNSYSSKDIADTKVHLHLSSFHPFIIDEEIEQLLKKGREFNYGDMEFLYKKEKNLLGKTTDKYKDLMEKGQCEISTSPMTHPILPLLYKTDIAKETKTSLNIPAGLFSYPEDARTQLTEGVETYRRIFGKPPAGIWPSEGSVSNEILEMFAENGILWTATDEHLLAETLSMPLLQNEQHQRWIFRDNLYIFFRDHHLSDIIGFGYQKMEEKEAAMNFTGQLHRISEKGERQLITIILDGENPWDFYPSFGAQFLPTLYAFLSGSSNIKTLTLSQAVKVDIREGRLEKIAPGSWMGVNFDNWIGKKAANDAWKALKQARMTAEERKDFLSPQQKRELKEYIMLAESSDWFWWYSLPADPKTKRTFDSFFRNALKKIYEIAGVDMPEFLNFPIEEYSIEQTFPYIQPLIDGKVTHFYEWHNAIKIDPFSLWATFKPVDIPVKNLFYGYDDENLYIRIDIVKDVWEEICLSFQNSVKKTFTIKQGETQNKDISFCIGDIIEIKIPKKEILKEGENDVFFTITIKEKEGQEFVMPGMDYFRVHFSTKEENWIV